MGKGAPIWPSTLSHRRRLASGLTDHQVTAVNSLEILYPLDPGLPSRLAYENQFLEV
jgi:hypothetical protein